MTRQSFNCGTALVCGLMVTATCLCAGAEARAEAGERTRIFPAIGAGPQPGIGRMPLNLRQQETFYQDHLLPAMSRQLENMTSYRGAMASAGALPFDPSAHEGWVDAARRVAERGARDALESYLLEFTPLGRGVRSIRSKGERLEAPVATGAGSTVRFGLGVSHGTPKVRMRYGRGAAALEVGLGVDSSLGIEFSHSAATHTRLKADYRPDEDRYRLSCLFSF